MKSNIIARIIFLVLIIGTFSAIFGFSNQDGAESKSVSRKVMRQIINIYPKTNTLNEMEKEKLIENCQPFIRKLAHFTIYMVLGIMIMAFFCTFDIAKKRGFYTTIVLGIIYAISDEIHQGFTGGGRTPKVFDIFVDTSGVIVGSVLVFFIHFMFYKIYKKIKKIKR